MARYVEDRSHATLFVRGSLDELLPEDSVARLIFETLCALDFSAFDAAYVNDDTGRPALDPRRLAAVWLLALVRGETSSVAVARLCGRDVEFRWLMGDAAVEKSTLCEFRKNHLEALAQLSTQVLAALARRGMLPAEELVADGTIIRAAAACGANLTREQLQKRVARLHEAIAQKLAEAEEAEPAADAPAVPGAAGLAQRLARYEAVLAEMEALGLTQATDRYTLTEPEASLKKLKTGGFAPAHNVQVVSDAGSGAILYAAVVDQANDQGLLAADVAGAQDELARVVQRLHETPESAPEPLPGPVRRVGADGAYHDTLQLVAFEEAGIEAVVPDGQPARRVPGVAPGFEAAAFVHDPETDTLVCPQGERLGREGLNEGKTAARYRAPASACGACPHKPGCCPTAQAHGRTVNRPLYEETLATVAQRVASPEGQRLRRARSVTAEGGFARLVEGLAWRRCRLWGRAGAQAETLWRQVTHNLLLLLEYWRPLVYKSG